MATTKTPNPAAQFRTTGFVLSDDMDMVLKDLFAAMDATAFAYEMDLNGSGNIDLTGEQVAAVLRTFSRVGKFAMRDAAYATNVPAISTTRDFPLA